MIENDIAQLIANLGFPIVITSWFMLRTDKKLDAIVEAIHSLKKEQ